MKRYLKVRINTDKNNTLLLKLNKINADIKNINYTKEYIIFDINYQDLKRVKRYLISYNIEVIDETGIYKIKKEISKNLLFFVGLIFSFLVFTFLSNIIIKVNVIHQNKEIRELIKSDLKEYGITPLSMKKSYDEYEEVITKIKENHKDKIEWLEIDVDGMVINIRVEERIITNYETKTGPCNIIATKSGTIRSLLTSRGVPLVKINDYVKMGDTLISGEVKLNEEVKNDVCASGNVYAEVWYNVQASIPLNYIEETKTGKMRYNLLIKKGPIEKEILKPRVKDSKLKKYYLFKIFDYEFYFVKDYEVTKTNKKYSETEALNILKKEITQKLTVNSKQITKIINEKVLQKSVNNDKLNIDMFIAVEEQIGKSITYQRETESD